MNSLAISPSPQSQPFDTRISYLKILALSLLREIASAENIGEAEVNDTIDLQAEVQRFEKELIRSALIHTGGRQRQAARLLRTKVTTLNTKIKKYGIETPIAYEKKTSIPPFTRNVNNVYSFDHGAKEIEAVAGMVQERR